MTGNRWIQQYYICSTLLLLALPQCLNIVVQEDNQQRHQFDLIHQPSCNSIHRSVLFASLMNGEVIALDLADGRVLWSVHTGSKLLSSSLSNLEVIYNGIPTRLVPSLDGSLFRFHDDSFEPLPFTAETLLSSSFKLPGDSTMVGSKDLRTVGLDPSCGVVFYKCDKEGCDRNEQQNLQKKDILVIKHMTHTIRAASVRDGSEKWNFSVGHHELTFSQLPESQYTAGGEDRCDSSSCPGGFPTLKFAVAEGTVIRLVSDNSSEKLWEKQLATPISKSWVLRNGQLDILDLLNPKFLTFEERMSSADRDADLTVPSPSFYIGVFEKQVYLQSSMQMEKNVSALVERYKRGPKLFTKLPKVRWAPYLSSTPSRTPSLNYGQADPTKVPSTTVSKPHTSALSLLNPDMDYPYDHGFYLTAELSAADDRPNMDDVAGNDYEDEDWMFEDIENTIIIQMVSLQFYWKEVLAISLLSAVLLNGIFYLTRAQRRLLKNKLKCFANEEPSDTSDDEGKQHKPASVKEAEPMPAAVIVPPPQLQYHSRYQTDFMHVQCLGKGGFGVVFHARNALDECDYAIKRITLSNSDDAKEKVTREVKALAKLDHPNIVRYFQSWFETPPPGWQEDRDKIWESTEKFMPTPMNSARPISRQQSQVIKGAAGDVKNTETFVPRFKFDDSKDTTASFGFPVNSRLDDSLEIVFTSRAEDSSINQPFHKYAMAPLDHEKDDDSDSSKELERLDDSGYHKNSLTLFKTQGSFDNDSEKDGPDVSASHLPTSPIEKKETDPRPKLFLYIQMQLCKRETLRDYLNANTLYRDRKDILLIFRQICDAVEYIHSQGLIHRDLKPTNIFFSTENIIKVGDFGLVTASSVFPEDNSERMVNTHTSIDYLNLTHNVGTQTYMSPEQIAGKQYNSKVDIYALGLVFFEMKYPFSTAMERVITLKRIKDNVYPERFMRELPMEYKFVKWMLSRYANKRPSITEVLNSEVMSDSDNLIQADRIRTRTVSRSSSSND